MPNLVTNMQIHQASSVHAQSNSLRARVKKLQQTVLALLAICLLTGVPAWAGSYDNDTGIQRAYSILQNRQNATDILSFVHFGATYNSHEYLQTRSVVDGSGNPIDGDFALVYRFHWEGDGVTDIAFFCHSSGQIYKSQIVRTNALLSQPFALANLSIQMVGRMVVNSDDRMSNSDRELAIKLIDDADAHGLLDLWLTMQ
ncbi:MAG TPA: hypothetical protein VHD85_02090 [Terracidiphilus sp.]|nr:hypothetical protein [Terracidiphilus sp.]